MGHGITNQFLYTVTNIQVTFESEGETLISSGTGFFIKKGEEIFLITNRHVVDLNYDKKDPNPYKIKAINIDARSINPIYSSITHNKAAITSYRIKFDSNGINDVACIHNIHIDNNINGHLLFIPYEMLATKEQYFNSLAVADQLAFIGFPKVADKKNHMPILRIGHISSDPRLDYSYDENLNLGQCAAYEAFGKPGFSGSPVFSTQIGFPVSGILSAPKDFYRPVLLIGIQSKAITQKVFIGKDEYKEHSQLCIFYKSTIIKDLIDSIYK